MPSGWLMDWVRNQEKEERMSPSKTPKQARTMAAAAHDPKFAKKVGIKPSVAREFNAADTGTKKLSNAMKKGAKKSGAKKRGK